MKKHFLVLSFAAMGAMFCACDEQHQVENFTQEEEFSFVDNYRAPAFAEPDNKSKTLSGTPAENLKALFEATGPEVITDLGRMNITDAQYKEIKTFTTDLVKGISTQTEQYRTIFRWIVSNIKYDFADNDPYTVFTNKIAICQGYANLLVTMCMSQGIPAVVVNGYAIMGQNEYGHAWAYVYTDDKWEVSDPTNSGSWPMSNVSNYTHLRPSEADVNLFSDEVAAYCYYDNQLNIKEIATKKNPFIAPYSVGGFVITSFNPSVMLPEHITDVYLGENITSLGEDSDNNMNMNLIINDYGKYIQAIHIDEKNPRLEEYKGLVYLKGSTEGKPYYIPGGVERVEIKPVKVVGKNFIYNLPNAKEIYFPKGVEEIEAYAIENCKNLERVYVPEGAKISSSALYNCNRKAEIIRGVPSSINHVTM